jgi:hypothetical protein
MGCRECRLVRKWEWGWRDLIQIEAVCCKKQFEVEFISQFIPLSLSHSSLLSKLVLLWLRRDNQFIGS